MPPIQSKEVLLLDQDYNRAFSKRKIESNWDRYAELSNDEDNAQLMAADFDKILLAPKSVGEHFTFASERVWEQDADVDADSQSNDLFKLNLLNLKNGAGRLPFYLRNDLPLNMFSDEEISDMNFRVNFYDNKEKQMVQTKSNSGAKEMGKRLMGNEKLESGEMRSRADTSTVQTNVRLSESITKLAASTGSLMIQQTPSQSQMSTIGAQTTAANNKTENIQDWLDDILNEN